MTELEKLDAGLEYDFWDDEANVKKAYAMKTCQKLNSLDPTDEDAIAELLKNFFGSAGESPWTDPGFQCDYEKNIHVGKHFTANHNVTILDIAPVHIGDHCMIGPNTMICIVAGVPAKVLRNIENDL